MLVASLLISTPSFAAFVPYDTFTTDTVSGLRWLHSDKTAGKSYEYINGQLGLGGAYEGYRFATVAEVSKLLFGSSTFLTSGSRDDGYLSAERAGAFLNIFNIQVSSATYSMSGLMQNQNFLGVYADFYPTAEFGDQSQYNFYGQYSNYEQYKNVTGAYLVNPLPTPLPAAVFMFAPVLLGFMGLRRKAKNTVA